MVPLITVPRPEPSRPDGAADGPDPLADVLQPGAWNHRREVEANAVIFDREADSITRLEQAHGHARIWSSVLDRVLDRFQRAVVDRQLGARRVASEASVETWTVIGEPLRAARSAAPSPCRVRLPEALVRAVSLSSPMALSRPRPNSSMNEPSGLRDDCSPRRLT